MNLIKLAWPLVFIFSAGLYIYTSNTQQEPQQALQKREHPNIVYIFPDEWRGSALGFLGKEPVQTPNLDKLAKESVVLTNAVSNYPVCVPCRTMLMSGKYCNGNGVVTNMFHDKKDMKPTKWLIDALMENNYEIGYTGKWHVSQTVGNFYQGDTLKGYAREWLPFEKRHGIKYFYNHISNDHMNSVYWNPEDGPNDYKKIGKWSPYFDTEKAIDYINNKEGKLRDDSKPFALFLVYNPPHTSYQTFPKELRDKYKDMPDSTILNSPAIPGPNDKWGKFYRKNIRGYYSMISGEDSLIGNVLDALKAKGLDQNTIVVFTSDHGTSIGKHGRVTKNHPFEEAYNIPFIIRYPEKIKPRQDNLLLSIPDIYPTLMDLAGLKEKIPSDLEGQSLAQTIMTGEGPRPSSQMYLFIPYQDHAQGIRGVRTQQYTCVFKKKGFTEELSGGQRPFDWQRLPMNSESNDSLDVLLYDYKNDVNELHNLAKDHPQLVNQLFRDELLPWLKRTNDPWLK